MDHNGDENIVVIRDVEPCMCGGTRETLDRSSPKEINCDQMVYFYATTSLVGCVRIGPDGNQIKGENISYISAFAAPCKRGYFISLVKTVGNSDTEYNASVVKESPFPRLCDLVRKCDLAKNNGRHSQTYGLPQNFGGNVDIRYADGSRIDFSNNQSPVMGFDTVDMISIVFGDALAGEKAELYCASAINEIRFCETRDDGGFTKADLRFLPDGKAINHKTTKYDESSVYESDKEVDSQTVKKIKEIIQKNLMTAWEGLPANDFRIGPEKSLTFVFENGSEITVHDGRALPLGIAGSFFNIELELTVKH